MKFKTKYLAKRIFAMALAIALLWSDSSVVSLAQTMTGENGATLENPGEISGGYSDDLGEEISGGVF